MDRIIGESFRNTVPDELRTLENIEGYFTVLDGLHDDKQQEMRRALRVFCPPLLTNLAYLRLRAEDVGWPQVPIDFPKEILDAMVLNAEGVFSLAGTYKGLDYWIRVLTQGAPAFSGVFLPTERYIVPDDVNRGFLSDDTWNGTFWLRLFSGADDDVTAGTLHVQVATPYWELDSLEVYLNDTFRQMLGFTSPLTDLKITLIEGPYVPNPHANQFFVIK
jgi:hypothetical protein